LPTFVHIADERDATAIRRTGLKLPRYPGLPPSDPPHGVFAMPVVPSFVMTHQWLRELKRRGHRTAVGIYLKLPADDEVWAGLYNEPKRRMTAAEATSVLRGMQVFGFEVIIPRSIPAGSITAVRQLPQTIGWRYFPNAHERGIFCGCDSCMRGEIRGRKIRDRYEAGALKSR